MTCRSVADALSLFARQLQGIHKILNLLKESTNMEAPHNSLIICVYKSLDLGEIERYWNFDFLQNISKY